MQSSSIDVIVIGGGFAGLSATYYLQQKGLNVKLFELSNRLGGRAKSDYIDGYILDRGTHFYHHSTTELSKIIDIKELELKNIYPGYLLRYKQNFLLYSNPLFKSLEVLPTAFATNTSLTDKIRLFGFYVKLKAQSYASIIKQKETSTYQYLVNNGFSKESITTLFKPLLAATIFDKNLQSSSKLSMLYLKSLFNDHVALPQNGIGAIAEAIAKRLQPASICLKSKVKRINGNTVEFVNGSKLQAKAIVVATNAIDAKQICSQSELTTESTHVSTLYFSADKAPVTKPIILLNSNEQGLINHILVPSLLHKSYAPKGKHLIAINIVNEQDLDDDELIENCLIELTDWFGLQVKDWQHIKTYHIKYAMPFKPILDDVQYTCQINDTIFYAGDALAIGTMEAALRSGRETASKIYTQIQTQQEQIVVVNTEEAVAI